MTYTLRIDSGFGRNGYQATVYGPGLPVVEPYRNTGALLRDIERVIEIVRRIPRRPVRILGGGK